jgi:glycerate kinase
MPGAGAAGGLGFALAALLGAELVRGVDLIIEETRLADHVAGSDVVVTGEGRLDAQTAMGKAPIGVARLAKAHGARTIALAGCIGDGAEALNAAGIDAFFPVLRKVVPLDEALDAAATAANIAATSEQAFRCLRAGGMGK